MLPRLYFDYNAATPKAPRVGELLQEFSKAVILNPSSLHAEGRKARARIDSARESFASLLDCKPNEIIFTSGATEANNLLLRGLAQKFLNKKILMTRVEHDSVLEPIKNSFGSRTEFIHVDPQGQIDLDEYENQLDDQVAAVAVMLANNETGFIFPVREMASLALRRGIYFHCDMACALGKLPLSFHELGVDSASFSGGKFYALSGIGGLIVKNNQHPSPLQTGGPQERGWRAGTENVLGILSLPLGLDFSLVGLADEMLRMNRLRGRLKQDLGAINSGVKFYESSSQQLPGTLNFGFPNISGRILMSRLDLEGVATSFGSACHSGSAELSRVLLELGYSRAEAGQSLRLSFGRMTTEVEIDGLLAVLARVHHQMRL